MFFSLISESEGRLVSGLELSFYDEFKFYCSAETRFMVSKDISHVNHGVKKTLKNSMIEFMSISLLSHSVLLQVFKFDRVPQIKVKKKPQYTEVDYK